MGFFHYLNVGLIYVTVGFACAIYYVFVIRRRVLGSFWGALIVGVIGSFCGGIVHQLFPRVIEWLTDFQSVNLVAAFLGALLFCWVLGKASTSK